MGSNKKQVKIAPKVSVFDDSTNIITQAWLNASCVDSSGNSPDLRSQLMKYDSGIEMKSNKSSSDTSLSDKLPVEETKPVPGLPRPKKYRKRKTKKHGKGKASDKAVELNETSFSDTSMNDILASLENEFSSPMRNLLRTPPKSSTADVTTSTPCKPCSDSPSWLSPIKGLTPLRSTSNFLDSGIFTPIQDKSKQSFSGFTPVRSGLTPSDKDFSHSFDLLRSPKEGSLRDLGLPGLTPLKHLGGKSDLNHSFSKIFGELPLESIMEEGGCMPIDIGNISLSAFQ